MTSLAFHLAIPVRDLETTRAFYGDLLGCTEGRSAKRWVDFDFFSHQLSFHVTENAAQIAHNPVDGDAVPIPHFGAVLEWDTWHALAKRLEAADVSFIIPPRIRFKGKVGEQATMFLFDPNGHALEFKAFKDPSQLYAKDPQ